MPLTDAVPEASNVPASLSVHSAPRVSKKVPTLVNATLMLVPDVPGARKNATTGPLLLGSVVLMVEPTCVAACPSMVTLVKPELVIGLCAMPHSATSRS